MQGKYVVEIELTEVESRTYYYVTGFSFDLFDGIVSCDDGLVKSQHTFQSKNLLGLKVYMSVKYREEELS